MRTRFRRWVASLIVAPAVWGAWSSGAEASIFDCFTGKKSPPPSSGCKSGQCGAPGAAAPGTVPAGTQPYMVPIGPPRYVPAAPGSIPSGTAPSLSPTGAGIPSSDPTTVSRPTYPPLVAPQTSYYQPGPVPSGTPVATPLATPGARVAAPAPAAGAYAPGAYAGAACPTAACPTCQQTVGVNYAPYTAYYDQTIKVPTTLYRPVTVVDPRTGAPTTVLQPCQTSGTMVQRKPAAFSRSFARAYRPLPVSNKPAVPTGAPVVFAPTYAVPTYSVPTGGAPVVMAPASNTWNRYGAVAPASAYAPAPTYAVPYSAPTVVGGYPTVPATGYVPAAPAPAASAPLSPSAPPASPHSATLALPPPPPLNGPAAPSRAGDAADFPPTLKSPAPSAPSHGGATFRPSFPSTPRDTTRSTPAAADGAAPLQPVPSDAFPLRPIPVPEENSTPSVRDRVPPLIVPAQERTAATAGDQRTLASEFGSPARSVRTTSVTQPRRTDDSGWRSLTQ